MKINNNVKLDELYNDKSLIKGTSDKDIFLTIFLIKIKKL